MIQNQYLLKNKFQMKSVQKEIEKIKEIKDNKITDLNDTGLTKNAITKLLENQISTLEELKMKNKEELGEIFKNPIQFKNVCDYLNI